MVVGGGGAHTITISGQIIGRNLWSTQIMKVFVERGRFVTTNLTDVMEFSHWPLIRGFMEQIIYSSGVAMGIIKTVLRIINES